jgi:threonine dehydrogenase-like Zn-dependent dehydrogenase
VAKLDDYRNVSPNLPREYRVWQLHGAGFESLGTDGGPETIELRPPKENEILLRVDALGLCQSDIKIINQGSKHPRLRGRDLAVEPTVLGHECAATVVAVGDRWKDSFQVGDRFIVQADIYYQGQGFAFGYLIPGGLAEYFYLDERALEGDEGCYLLPVQPESGYSQVALAEPWACVEMSYCLSDRTAPGDGELLIVTDDDPRDWREANPDAVIVPRTLEGLDDEKFDDIIVHAPTPALVDALSARMRKNAAMYLLGAPAEDGKITLDIGRIHYEGLRYYGGGDSMDAVSQANSRNDLLPGGSALFVGAGGPMGQMHVQRAIEVRNRPARVVVTDLDRTRLNHIQNRFGELARKNGVQLFTLAPEDVSAGNNMDDSLRSLAPEGYTDIVICAPLARLVPQMLPLAADGAFVNIFAGVPAGQTAEVELRDLCRGIKLIGSSGSRISDLQKVLNMVQSRELNTDYSVAAIGGLNAAHEGLEGVRDAKYPGKIVIYPQIPDLPLTPLEQIPERFPELADKLGPNNAWTKEAERALLEKYL